MKNTESLAVYSVGKILECREICFEDSTLSLFWDTATLIAWDPCVNIAWNSANWQSIWSHVSYQVNAL